MLDLPPTFARLDRRAWARLRSEAPAPLAEAEARALSGQVDPITAGEVEDVYLPLARLLGLHLRARGDLVAAYGQGLALGGPPAPFVVGVTGSVAAGKSTTSRVLAALLRRLPGQPRVAVVATDGFLRPTTWLEQRGLMHQKGFPSSYDREAMVAALTAIKAGRPAVRMPVYSHRIYDIVPGAEQVVDPADIVVVEGLHLLTGAVASAGDGLSAGAAPRDLVDFAIYVDADTEVLERWYVERFMLFRQRAEADPSAFFHRFVGLAEADARDFATRVWQEINARNLERHILPYRASAQLVLHKRADHTVASIHLRRP